MAINDPQLPIKCATLLMLDFGAKQNKNWKYHRRLCPIPIRKEQNECMHVRNSALTMLKRQSRDRFVTAFC